MKWLCLLLLVPLSSHAVISRSEMIETVRYLKTQSVETGRFLLNDCTEDLDRLLNDLRHFPHLDLEKTFHNAKKWMGPRALAPYGNQLRAQQQRLLQHSDSNVVRFGSPATGAVAAASGLLQSKFDDIAQIVGMTKDQANHWINVLHTFRAPLGTRDEIMRFKGSLAALSLTNGALFTTGLGLYQSAYAELVKAINPAIESTPELRLQHFEAVKLYTQVLRQVKPLYEGYLKELEAHADQLISYLTTETDENWNCLSVF